MYPQIFLLSMHMDLNGIKDALGRRPGGFGISMVGFVDVGGWILAAMRDQEERIS